ncbi:hypothetical protein ACLOJK_009264 [Asimina triloba]
MRTSIRRAQGSDTLIDSSQQSELQSLILIEEDRDYRVQELQLKNRAVLVLSLDSSWPALVGRTLMLDHVVLDLITGCLSVSSFACLSFSPPRPVIACNVQLVMPRHLKVQSPVFGADFRAFANRKSVRRTRKDWKEPKSRTLDSNKNTSNEYDELVDGSSIGGNSFSDDCEELLNDNLVVKNYTPSPRNDVLQACIVTSGLIFALGMIIRQVLGSLRPLDYVLIAFLPGISETRNTLIRSHCCISSQELLFRGALMPIFGLSWKTALAVGAIFGALHLGSGRKYSFALWATFVGLSYGLATIMTSSIIVPIAAHSLNNLIGGILWRCTSPSWKQDN